MKNIKNYLDLAKDSQVIEDMLNFVRGHIQCYNTYVMAFRNEDGSISLHERINRPCLGEMRAYKEKSKNRQKDRFPTDLKNNFPDGTPLGVAMVVSYPPGLDEEFERLWSEYNPFVGEFSQYIHLIKKTKPDEVDKIVSLDKKETLKSSYCGVLIRTSDIPATWLVSSMRSGRYVSPGYKNTFNFLKNHVSPKEAHLISLLQYNSYGVTDLEGKITIGYSTSLARVSLDKYFKGKRNDLDGGLLWSDRADYHRPAVDYIFAEEYPENSGNQLPRYPNLPVTVSNLLADLRDRKLIGD